MNQRRVQQRIARAICLEHGKPCAVCRATASDVLPIVVDEVRKARGEVRDSCGDGCRSCAQCCGDGEAPEETA